MKAVIWPSIAGIASVLVIRFGHFMHIRSFSRQGIQAVSIPLQYALKTRGSQFHSAHRADDSLAVNNRSRND